MTSTDSQQTSSQHDTGPDISTALLCLKRVCSVPGLECISQRLSGPRNTPLASKGTYQHNLRVVCVSTRDGHVPTSCNIVAREQSGRCLCGQGLAVHHCWQAGVGWQYNVVGSSCHIQGHHQREPAASGQHSALISQWRHLQISPALDRQCSQPKRVPLQAKQFCCCCLMTAPISD